MEKLLRWHGRIGRAEFFSYSFGLGILNAVMGLIVSFLPGSILPSLSTIAVSLFFAYISICLAIRRLHDLNKPGWYYFAFSISMLALYYIEVAFAIGLTYIAIPVSFFGVVAIYFFKGTDGDNQYGPDPLGLTIAVTSEDAASE